MVTRLTSASGDNHSGRAVCRCSSQIAGGQRAATFHVMLLSYLLTYLNNGNKLTLRYLLHDLHHFGWVHQNDILTEEQRLLIRANFGSTNPERIRLLYDYLVSVSVPAAFRLYEGIGHQITFPILYDAFDFSTQIQGTGSSRLLALAAVRQNVIQSAPVARLRPPRRPEQQTMIFRCTIRTPSQASWRTSDRPGVSMNTTNSAVRLVSDQTIRGAR